MHISVANRLILDQHTSQTLHPKNTNFKKLKIRKSWIFRQFEFFGPCILCLQTLSCGVLLHLSHAHLVYGVLPLRKIGHIESFRLTNMREG